MNNILIGNIVAFIASIFMVYTGVIKEKKKILYVQSIQISLFVASNLILGGFTGAIINVLNLVRNIICYKDKLDLKAKIIITILSTVLTLLFNNLGIIGLLPLATTVLYIWFMNVKDVVKFKILLASTVVMWLIYDLCIKSYTSAVFDFVTIIATIFSIFSIERGKRNIKKG